MTVSMEKNIGIYFHDNSITHLFSDLLSSMKINNRILIDETEILETSFLITEPMYYETIKGRPDTKCIVVGSENNRRHESVIEISQPLTEKKILSALFELVVD